MIGNHWQDVGFQGTDPRTDIRDVGILGLLHILFFVDKYSQCAQIILKYSQNPRYEFPLAIKMFEMTILTLQLMREDKLNYLCN
mmetsp:Transcript_25413/g.24750  ORF Transcript_25413/g.24750 Transcript_25413/m.24750 type:complete len:84 (-) Transcript_25413:395-646(-)